MDARSPLALRNVLAALVAVLLVLPAAAGFAQEAAEDETPVLAAIEIAGNTHTDRTLILREMGLTIGQRFAFDDMDAVWDKLEDTGFFAFVDMEYDDSTPGEVTLRVTVEEDLHTEYGPLVRYARRHKYLLGGRLKENNFRGKGETVEAALGVYWFQRAELAWSRPWFLGVDGLRGRVAGAWEQADFVFRPTRYRKWDAGLDLTYTVAGPVSISGVASYGEFRQRDAYTWALPDRGAGAPAGDALFPAATRTHWVFDLALTADTRNNPYYPRKGGFLEVRGRRWLGNGFADYSEAAGDARAFLPVPVGKHVLAAHAWGRRTSGPAQLDNVLYLGGPQSVRGYRFGSLEGDEGWLLSVEYRIPLFIMPISPKGELVGLGVHLFGDAGDAWYRGADPHGPSRSWGGGLHLNLETLQLRFEGARTDEGNWVFEFMDRFNF